MNDVCGDNRFELIEKYKQKLIKATNIEDSPEEMAVIDNILFRCWQIGWIEALDLLEKQEQAEAKITFADIETATKQLEEMEMNTHKLQAMCDLYDKQQRGLIIELPVPIESYVYEANSYRKQVYGYFINSETTVSDILDINEDWGKVYFATREEAEARLKELKNV